MLSFELINLHRCWPHEQNTFYTYNRGQTSWNTLAFVGLSWNHTWPTSAPPPSPNHKQGWTGVSRIFPEFPLYIGWGEGEPQDFSERLINCTVLWQHPQITENHKYCIADPRTFFLDCRFCYSWEFHEWKFICYRFIHFFFFFFFAIKTVPSENVALPSLGASVIEGVSRSRNALLNGEVGNYDWNIGYTCHQLGSGAIVVQLPQPYIIGSMRWEIDAE